MRVRLSFFERDAIAVAQAMLGCHLCRDEVVLRITEVEAYGGPTDTAAHARMGRTERNAPLWGPRGRLYVYLCYGLHWLLNVVVGEEEGAGQAVLVRSGEVVAGHELVKRRRGGRIGPDAVAGPGKLGAALALDGTFNHHPLTEPGGIELLEGRPPEGILVGPRVGVDYAKPEHRDAPWRFAIAGCPAVSVRRTLRLL